MKTEIKNRSTVDPVLLLITRLQDRCKKLEDRCMILESRVDTLESEKRQLEIEAQWKASSYSGG